MVMGGPQLGIAPIPNAMTCSCICNCPQVTTRYLTIGGDVGVDDGDTFGGDVEYANKVTYNIQNPIINQESTFTLTYSAELLKAILVANKNSESGNLHVNSNGLMKLTFEHKGMQSIYYIVAKSE